MVVYLEYAGGVGAGSPGCEATPGPGYPRSHLPRQGLQTPGSSHPAGVRIPFSTPFPGCVLRTTRGYRLQRLRRTQGVPSFQKPDPSEGRVTSPGGDDDAPREGTRPTVGVARFQYPAARALAPKGQPVKARGGTPGTTPHNVLCALKGHTERGAWGHRSPRWGEVSWGEVTQGSAPLHPGLSPCAALRRGRVRDACPGDAPREGTRPSQGVPSFQFQVSSQTLSARRLRKWNRRRGGSRSRWRASGRRRRAGC